MCTKHLWCAEYPNRSLFDRPHNIINHFVYTLCKQRPTFNFHLFLVRALRNCRRSPIIMNMNGSFFLSPVFLFVLILLSIAMQLAAVHFPHSCSWRDKTVCLQFRAVWRTEFVLTFWHVYICVFFSHSFHSPTVYSHCDFAFVCCFAAKPEE